MSVVRLSDCLGDETIAALLEGGLPEPPAALARAHLATCVACRKLVAAAVEVDEVQSSATLRDLVRHASDLLPGVVLGQRYRIESALGEGGMGRIFVATQLGLGRAVAIKVLRPELLGVEQSLVRFQREARLLASLASHHVVRVFDIGELGDGTPYLVTELLEGEDLAAVLARGPVAAEQAVRWMLDACSGLAEAHALGIIHRDLKPSNLFVTRHGRVMILDFGLAKLAQSTGRNATTLDGRGSTAAAVTSVGMLLGSPHYMAPEQAMGGGAATIGTDIWALGATLVHLVTGRPPFPEANLEAVLAAILSARGPSVIGMPVALAAIAQRAMAMEPMHRYASVTELAADLSTSLVARPMARQPTPVPTVAQRPAAPPKRRAWLWVLVTLTLGAIAFATAVTITRGATTPRAELRVAKSPSPTAPIVAAPVSKPAAPVAPAPGAPALVDEDFLLGLYVTCFDNLDEQVRQSWEDYTAFADPSQGPDLTRARAPRTLDGHPATKCREALDGTRALAALARPTQTYRDALDSLATTLRAVNEQYTLGSHLTDPAAAKRMHRELQVVFGAFDEADAALRWAWMERHRVRAPERLGRLLRAQGSASELFVTEQALIAADAVISEPLRGSAVLMLEEAYAAVTAEFGADVTAAQDTDRFVFKEKTLALLGAAKAVQRDGASARAALVSAYNALIDRSNDTTWTTTREQRASARPPLRATEQLFPAPVYKAVVPPPAAPSISAADYDEAAIRARFETLGWVVGDVTRQALPGCVHIDVRAARPGQGASAYLLECESEAYAVSEAARLTKMPNNAVRQAGSRVLLFSAWGSGLASTAEATELAAAFLVR